MVSLRINEFQGEPRHNGLLNTLVDAIVNMPPPIDVPSLQQFLGMTKYVS